MSSIQSAGGLRVPTFQPASSKGDGAGNGGGGMYFGEEPQEEQPGDADWFSNPFSFRPPTDLKDIPYVAPTTFGGESSQALRTWKTALARQLYENLIPVNAYENN